MGVVSPVHRDRGFSNTRVTPPDLNTWSTKLANHVRLCFTTWNAQGVPIGLLRQTGRKTGSLGPWRRPWAWDKRLRRGCPGADRGIFGEECSVLSLLAVGRRAWNHSQTSGPGLAPLRVAGPAIAHCLQAPCVRMAPARFCVATEPATRTPCWRGSPLRTNRSLPPDTSRPWTSRATRACRRSRFASLSAQ